MKKRELKAMLERVALDQQPAVMHVEVNLGAAFPTLIVPFLVDHRSNKRIDLPALGYVVTRRDP